MAQQPTQSRDQDAAKGHISDSGLLCSLAAIDAARLQSDGPAAGMVFETFVAMELARQVPWRSAPVRLYHYRDREKREVDMILERRDGAVIAVEIKTAASAASEDFRALRYLRDRLGTRFKTGALVYTGAHTMPFGDWLASVPLCGL